MIALVVPSDTSNVIFLWSCEFVNICEGTVEASLLPVQHTDCR